VPPPPWEIVLHEKCEEWLDTEPDEVAEAIATALVPLRERGPSLGRPLVDTLKGAPIPNLKELRVQVGGRPYRILFAFDPSRRAVLLVGGDKGTDEKRWYEVHIPIAVERAKHHGIG
jgi:hypothetical protein